MDNAPNDICIYCAANFDSQRGEGDHVIPVQLGQFDGDSRFRGACSTCNNQIGRSEEQFLRCSPIAIYRRLVNPAVPGRRKRKNSYGAGSLGVPPPEHTVVVNGCPSLVDVSPGNPEDVYPVDQLTVIDKEGESHYIKLHPKMRPEQLKQQLDQLDAAEVWANFDEEHFQAYSNLVKAINPQADMESLGVIEPGVHRTPGRIKCVFTEHYYRSIAKIAFHHLLCHTRRGYTGHEEHFEPIRNFIMNGGCKDDFFSGVKNQFKMPLGIMPDGRLLTSRRWHHLLAVDETGPEITAVVHLFIGPKGFRPPDVVRIAKRPTAVFVPSCVWGKGYTYHEDQTGNTAGSVEPITVSRPSPIVATCRS